MLTLHRSLLNKGRRSKTEVLELGAIERDKKALNHQRVVKGLELRTTGRAV